MEKVVSILLILVLSVNFLKAQKDTVLYDNFFSINDFYELVQKEDTLEFEHLGCWRMRGERHYITLENYTDKHYKFDSILNLNIDSLFEKKGAKINLILTRPYSDYEMWVFDLLIIRKSKKKYKVEFKTRVSESCLFERDMKISKKRIVEFKEEFSKLNYIEKHEILNEEFSGIDFCRKYHSSNYYFIIKEDVVYGFWQRGVFKYPEFYQNLMMLFDINPFLEKYYQQQLKCP